MDDSVLGPGQGQDRVIAEPDELQLAECGLDALEHVGREFGVALSAVSVGRMLKALGLSPQRPLYRAWQADPEAVAAWKQTEYPKIAAEAKNGRCHRVLRR